MRHGRQPTDQSLEQRYFALLKDTHRLCHTLRHELFFDELRRDDVFNDTSITKIIERIEENIGNESTASPTNYSRLANVILNTLTDLAEHKKQLGGLKVIRASGKLLTIIDKHKLTAAIKLGVSKAAVPQEPSKLEKTPKAAVPQTLQLQATQKEIKESHELKKLQRAFRKNRRRNQVTSPTQQEAEQTTSSDTESVIAMPVVIETRENHEENDREDAVTLQLNNGVSQAFIHAAGNAFKRGRMVIDKNGDRINPVTATTRHVYDPTSETDEEFLNRFSNRNNEREHAETCIKFYRVLEEASKTTIADPNVLLEKRHELRKIAEALPNHENLKRELKTLNQLVYKKLYTMPLSQVKKPKEVHFEALMADMEEKISQNYSNVSFKTVGGSSRSFGCRLFDGSFKRLARKKSIRGSQVAFLERLIGKAKTAQAALLANPDDTKEAETFYLQQAQVLAKGLEIVKDQIGRETNLFTSKLGKIVGHLSDKYLPDVSLRQDDVVDAVIREAAQEAHYTLPEVAQTTAASFTS